MTTQPAHDPIKRTPLAVTRAFQAVTPHDPVSEGLRQALRGNDSHKLNTTPHDWKFDSENSFKTTNTGGPESTGAGGPAPIKSRVLRMVTKVLATVTKCHGRQVTTTTNKDSKK